VVPAAEIDPADPREKFAELRLEGGQGALQGVGAHLAQGMEMQAADPLQGARVELRADDAQP